MSMVVSSGSAPDSFQPHETTDRLGLVEHILHAGVAEVVEELHAVNTQHDGQGIGMAALAGLGVEGADTPLQSWPGNQAIHPVQEQLPAGLAVLALVFQIGKGRLIHPDSLLYWCRPPRPYHAIIPLTCSEISKVFVVRRLAWRSRSKTVSRIVDTQKVRQGFVERREIGFRECGLVVGEPGRGDAKPNCLGSRGRLIDLLRRLQAGDSVPG